MSFFVANDFVNNYGDHAKDYSLVAPDGELINSKKLIMILGIFLLTQDVKTLSDKLFINKIL